MSLTISDLVKGFREAWLDKGDHVLVHSSLSSLGHVDGGAEAVIDALIEVVGEGGTVLFPTLSGCENDSADHPPVFDAFAAPCWVGTIPETARLRPEAIRSLHPTHSVAAIGELARWITAGHELVRTPCGHGSPYDKLACVGGKIVLIGVTQSVNTSFHHSEEIARVPYVLQDQPCDITITDHEGGQMTLSQTYLHRWGVRRDYDFLESALIDLGICRVRRVGEADVRVLDANFLRMFLVRRLLRDPLATLAISERERWLQ